MLNKIISKIPVKYHKGLRNGLLFPAFFALDFGAMALIAFNNEVDEATFFTPAVYHSADERFGYLVAALVLFAITIFCLLVALKLFTFSGKYNKYLAMIRGFKRIEIQQMADKTNSSPHKVQNDLQNMISSKYIEGYYLDYENGTLVNQNLKEKESSKTSFKCQQCGATNDVIVGVTKQCEYCGSPISPQK